MITEDFESAMKMRYLEVMKKTKVLSLTHFFIFSRSLDFVYPMEMFHSVQLMSRIRAIVMFNVLMIMNYH